MDKKIICNEYFPVCNHLNFSVWKTHYHINTKLEIFINCISSVENDLFYVLWLDKSFQVFIIIRTWK